MTTDDDRSDSAGAGRLAAQWSREIESAIKEQKPFLEAGRDVVKTYKAGERDAKLARASKKFNILYSNTEVLRSALYGRDAKPDVRRRFPDPAPVAREAATIIERALVYCQESYGSGEQIESALLDYLLPGRGVVRIEYEPVIGSRPMIAPQGMPVLDENGESAQEEFIADQKLMERYVFWEDFIHPAVRSWDKLDWIGFRHTFSRRELEDEIFAKAPATSQVEGDAASVPLNWSPDPGDTKIGDDQKKAEVWEIWDKVERRRLWAVRGHSVMLRIDEDPYGLEGFFPMPKPLASYATNDTFIPEPEYNAYRDQAADLNEITGRISRLTRALKRRGVYDQTITALKRLATTGDNDFIPVPDYAAFASKGGLQAAFQSEDLSPIIVVLAELHRDKALLIQSIYELTGIADIMRGSSDPRETLGAQQIKSQFGSLRLKRRQRAVQAWIRDMLRIKAEIIAEHYEPQVLTEMTGLQVSPQIIQLLRSEKLRGYQINVETDSTVLEDAQTEQRDRIEVLTAVGGFLQQAVPAIERFPQAGPLMLNLLGFGVRSFKAGRELEDDIEELRKLIPQIQQQQAGQGGDQAKQQGDAAKAAMQAQAAQGKLAIDARRLQLDEGKARADIALKAQEIDIKRSEAAAAQQQALMGQGGPEMAAMFQQFGSALQQMRQQIAVLQAAREPMQ